MAANLMKFSSEIPVLVTMPARLSLSLQIFIRSSVFSMPAVRSVVTWAGSIP